MATPTRSQGVSTPRNPLTSTPNRPTASPRPTTGHLQNRPFAHKSPAVKTPASTHGHSHRISISSQPTSTPLAAPAIHDELLNLNSPAAALIASIGTTGLTPLPSGRDGLGITTGFTPTPAQNSTLHQNPELERLHRLQQVAQLLEARSLGRGVTRKGVITLAKREKFDQVWDGDTVNIAGVSVDLEITFASDDKDIIRDVTLNLVTDDGGDPQLQESASAMLKRQLVSVEDQGGTRPWKSLDDFADNLHYLSHHDRLECSTNAFKLVGGLYQAFQSIWAEEKKRMKERHEIVRICQGNIGKPAIDTVKRLGLCTRYWVKKHEFVAATTANVGYEQQSSDTWTARFMVNRGEPSIATSQEWLDTEPLSNSVTTESVFQGSQAEKPNWKETTNEASDDDAVKQEVNDAMDLDQPSKNPLKSLGVHFQCVFEPMVLVPLNHLTELNAGAQMLQMNQSAVTTFQQALNIEMTRANQGVPTTLDGGRWMKTVSYSDKKGLQSSRQLAYMLFTTDGAWCYSLTQLSFSHPCHFVEAVPILRQCALLWSLLHTTFVRDHKNETLPNEVVKPTQQNTNATGIIKRSNKKPAQIQLEEILNGKREGRDTLNIDVSLDLVSDVTQAKLDVLIPVRLSNFIRVGIAVRRNGILDVTSVTGLTAMPEDKLKRQATKVLRISEDLGILAQWLLTQLPKATQ